MKTISKLLMVLVTFALLGINASCSKDDSSSSSNGGDTNGYSSLIVGLWNIDEVTDGNGQNIYNPDLGMSITFRADGTGMMTYASGYGPFTWSISGNNCKVYIDGMESPYDYTIVSLTATKIVFTSRILDLPGYNHTEGNFTWRLTKSH